MEDAELDPLHARSRRIGADLGSQLRQVDVEMEMEVDTEDGNLTSSTGTPESDSGPRPETIPVPDSPCLSAQLPSPHAPLDRHQHLESSFDKKCAPSQAPRVDGIWYGELTWGLLHAQCSQRGCRRKEWKAVLKTRLTATDAVEAKRDMVEVAQKDGKDERAPA